MVKLLLLFIAVPVAELALLIEIGRHIGTLATLGLIATTGILGAALARRQGLGVLRTVQTEMAAGRFPASSIVDGVIVLLAGAVLLTPGILTDALGFLCLIPWSRRWIKDVLWRWLKRVVQDGRVRVSVSAGAYGGTPPHGMDPEGERPDAPPPRVGN